MWKHFCGCWEQTIKCGAAMTVLYLPVQMETSNLSSVSLIVAEVVVIG